MMRKIVVSQFLTLDGVMEAPEKWSNYSADLEVVQELLADLSDTDLILFGKTTFDFFAERWPSRIGAMADYFNNLPKLVVSTTSKKTEWSNSTIVSTTPLVEIQKLKRQEGKNILVVGSYQLVQALISENLIDEYKLYVFPITLGIGKRLFENGLAGQTLKLKVANPFASGVIAATYQSGNMG